MQLNHLSDLINGELSGGDRKKIITLVTIDVHGRDVITKLINARVETGDCFEWQSQLRYYWEEEADDCIIRQTNTRFTYGYEYLGNSMRLVITPLTDKCYMTLMGAQQLNLGGAPAGPAGTKRRGSAAVRATTTASITDVLDMLLEDWSMKAKKMEDEEKARVELYDRTSSELRALIIDTQTAIENSKDQLSNTESFLAKTKAQLTETKANLNDDNLYLRTLLPSAN